jgi:hypothetical protein
MRRIAASLIAVVLLAGLVAGCGGDDDASDSAPNTPAELAPADVRANLEEAGYVLGEDVTEGANLALPPTGDIDAELYVGVEYDPEGERMYASVYFFADAADAETVAKAFSDSLTEVRDTRLYTLADEDQAVLDALVAAAEGE